MTLYALMEQLSEIENQLETERSAAMELARTPGSDMEQVRAAQQRVRDLQERYDILDGERQRLEAQAQERLRRQGDGQNPTMSFEEASGLFFRSVLNQDNRSLPQMAYEQLGLIPEGNTDQGNGSALVPKNLSNRLLLAPKVSNPLRSRMTVTSVTGLSVPKLDFSIGDDDFLSKDGETAKELAAAGDTVEFGRHKAHLVAKVSETLLRSTPLDIESAITSALDSAMANKELSVMFATAPKEGEEHMSFYQTGANAIKQIAGSNLIDTIIDAFGDLEDVYQAGAAVCMRRQDYYKAIRVLANGAESLFGKKPEDVIGYPVIFCDRATTPVVGDFAYLQENFDCPPWMDSDKDVKLGLRLMTETAVYDIKRLLNAAFRLVKVTASE